MIELFTALRSLSELVSGDAIRPKDVLGQMPDGALSVAADQTYLISL
jgi:hypothetical protein